MLGEVFVDSRLGVIEINGQFSLLGEGIINGFAQGAARPGRVAVLLKLFLDLIKDGTTSFAAPSQDFLGLYRQ